MAASLGMFDVAPSVGAWIEIDAMNEPRMVQEIADVLSGLLRRMDPREHLQFSIPDLADMVHGLPPGRLTDVRAAADAFVARGELIAKHVYTCDSGFEEEIPPEELEAAATTGWLIDPQSGRKVHDYADRLVRIYARPDGASVERSGIRPVETGDAVLEWMRMVTEVLCGAFTGLHREDGTEVSASLREAFARVSAREPDPSDRPGDD